jgi:hypothetical protein
MMDAKKLGSDTVKHIESLFVEMEGCKTLPNIVYMHESKYNILKEYFPYLIEGMYYKQGKNKLKILLTKEDEGVGVDFSLNNSYEL